MPPPIFVAVRDQLTWLKMLVGRLESEGCERIYLVDNDSRYEPLVEWLRASPHTVLHLGKNVGPRAFWSEGIFDRYAPRERYVLTDPDIVPADECPPGFLSYFGELLDRYPDITRAGFGLKIDDLPRYYRFRKEVQRWEAKMWSEELEPQVFLAEIDTTFALYREDVRRFDKAHLLGIRTGSPYLARHLPWYTDSSRPTEEERYYAEHARGSEVLSTWTQPQLPSAVRRAVDPRYRLRLRSARLARTLAGRLRRQGEPK